MEKEICRNYRLPPFIFFHSPRKNGLQYRIVWVLYHI